ncbi:MAG: MFS transporter [Vitreimonas sp.]
MSESGAPDRVPFKHVAAVSVGNALAFYDFLAYLAFAVQIGHTFFPDPHDSLMMAYVTTVAGFVARPIGAFVMGRVADKIGRRPAMMISLTLIGVAILGVVLTPPFRTIGWAAPIMIGIFRLILGFGVGGEVGPSTAYMLEAAPPEKRGYYTSLQAMTQDIASFLAAGVGFVIALVLNNNAQALDDWGWRLALLLGVSIVPFGLWLRRNLPETLGTVADAPEITAAPRSAMIRIAVLGFIILGTGSMVSYVQTTMTGYAQDSLHFSPTIAFAAVMFNGLFTFLFDPVSGWLSDRCGRRAVLIAGVTMTVIATLPAFWAILYFRSPFALCAATSVLGAITGIAQPPVATAISEALPQGMRSRGLGIVYAVAISVFGGLTPVTVTWLIMTTQNQMAPGYYMVGAAIVGLVAIFMLRETAPVVLARQKAKAA